MQILSSNWPDTKPRADPRICAVWTLTACLFAAGVLFAAFSGWAMTDKLADRDVQNRQIQATETNNGLAARILGILEDEGHAH